MSRSLLSLFLTLGICTAHAADAPPAGGRSTNRVHSALFSHQYTVYDREFCSSEVCIDFDGDSRRELLYASRTPGKLELLNAADGSIRWRRDWPGQQQSTSTFDLDADGDFEIVYTTSNPGILYVCDHDGNLLRQWDSGDHKLGNSPVVLDADGDGVLEGFLGTRSRELVRLRMSDLSVLNRRPDWVQCGCYTTAMDVDHDGQWDLFAGSGDDGIAKGVLHRFHPLSLESIWSFATNDNASSADPVLVDIDNDGQVEVIKSVDNYQHDDAHDAIYAFETDGKLLWQVPGFSEEDSPNVADLDGDGKVEIVGMTFGGEVYCLDPLGHIRWQRDLRPELDDATHMYMTPVLCDLDGDRELEILAMTHGPYELAPGVGSTARLTALDANGEVLDELDLGEPRYWGHAYVCNVDEDPFQELVVTGRGGLDVIQTRGYGPNTEHFQRRRSYQRLNVRPWAYSDTYFIERGSMENVVNRTDNLVLGRTAAGYVATGSFDTDLLTLPPDLEFRKLEYSSQQSSDTTLRVDAHHADGTLIAAGLESGTDLHIAEPVRLKFQFSTTDPAESPQLDSYTLRFDRRETNDGKEARAGFGSTFSITGPEQGAVDIPSTVPLSDRVDDVRRLALIETTDGKEVPLPSQVQIDGTDSQPRLWWIARGELPAGARRTYRLDQGEPAPADSTVVVDATRPENVTIRVGDARVLQYNVAHVTPPADIDARYGRSGHIHPAWTPSGQVVTDEFPPDHAHQSGLFLAYVKTEFEGRTPDFWNLLGGTGRVRSKGVTRTTDGPIFAEFQAVHEHVDQSASPEKVALNETWDVRVWNVGGREAGYWICDLTSRVECATSSPLHLPQYHYGGMALRGARQWTAGIPKFATSAGLDRVAGNHTQPWWCDLSGPAGDGTAGLLFVTHPDNFRAPEPLRIHPTMPYMVYTPSFLGEWDIKPVQPHVSRYRFVFHDGDLPPETANRLQRQFAAPLRATLE